MKEKELWKYFCERKAFHARHIGRDFIWVRTEDFEPVKQYFKKEFNILHRRSGSHRSRGYLRHIHALQQHGYVFIHRDTGNVARFLPLGILHLFVDVLPFEAYRLRTRKSRKTAYEHP